MKWWPRDFQRAQAPEADAPWLAECVSLSHGCWMLDEVLTSPGQPLTKENGVRMVVDLFCVKVLLYCH